MDANGYNPSIMQRDLTRCYLCGRSDKKLDRHEVFHADMGGKMRERSKAMGLWVMLCHDTCHKYGRHSVHQSEETALLLKRAGQERAQDFYGLTTDEFIGMFGKSYL